MASIQYPRRLWIRSLIKGALAAAFGIFTDLEVIGKENFPEQGPLIITGNHFSFADSVAMLYIAPPSIELFSGANPAFTPGWAKLLPRLWGVLYVYRGTASRQAIRDAQHVLEKKGFLVFFRKEGHGPECCGRPAPERLTWLPERMPASSRWLLPGSGISSRSGSAINPG